MKHHARQLRRSPDTSKTPAQHTAAPQQTPDLDEVMRMLAVGSPSDATTTAAAALQRTIGNRAATQLISHRSTPGQPVINRSLFSGWWSKKKTPANTTPPAPRVRNQSELEEMQNRLGSTNISATTPAAGGDDKVNPLDIASEGISDVTGGLELASSLKGDLTVEPKSAKYNAVYQDFLRENKLPSDTEESSLNGKQKEQLAEKQKDEGGLRVLVKDDNARADLGIAATAFQGFASVGGAASGIVGFVSSVQNWKEAENGWQRFDLAMDMVGQGSQTATGIGQAVTATGGVVAGGVARHREDLSDAKSAADGFSGVSDFLGALGGSVETVVSAAKIVSGIMQLFKGISEGTKSDQVLDITSHVIKVLKNFLNVSKSTISGLRTFLDIAGKSADFVAAVPVIGSAISIGIQLLDTLLQVVEIIRHAIRIAKAARIAATLKSQLSVDGKAVLDAKKRSDKNAALAKADDKDKLMLQLIDVNSKRVKRAALPVTTSVINIVANVISISGSILNIVGVATSAAYGAGVAIMAVGYGATATAGTLKLGTALAKPAAALIRNVKQQYRDLGVKNTTNSSTPVKWLAQYAAKHANTDKSSSAKQAGYLANAHRLMTIAKGLDVVQPSDADDVKAKKLESYAELEFMLKATGVNRKKLYKLNGNPAEQIKMLISAMKQRE